MTSAESTRILEHAWTGRYACPNQETYPWLWLWDSCFHAVVWAHRGDERSLIELDSVFARQTGAGFVPHMTYFDRPDLARDLWGVSGSSSITQPPMYGHALRVASKCGLADADSIVDRATRGLEFLCDSRNGASGLLRVVHPWETGCDDSVRWRHWQPDPFDRAEWVQTKLELVRSLQTDGAGMAYANPAFESDSVAFTALVAFNIHEIADLTGATGLAERGRALTSALEDCWSPTARTWVDGDHDGGAARTLESLLPLLVIDDREQADAAFELLEDPLVFWAPFGLRQTAPHEAGYHPAEYWRGPVWPQLCYLHWLAARRWGRSHLARRIADATMAGAVTSGFAEYWDAQTGEGYGAIPQTWTTLVDVMANAELRL